MLVVFPYFEKVLKKLQLRKVILDCLFAAKCPVQPNGLQWVQYYESRCETAVHETCRGNSAIVLSMFASLCGRKSDSIPYGNLSISKH